MWPWFLQYASQCILSKFFYYRIWWSMLFDHSIICRLGSKTSVHAAGNSVLQCIYYKFLQERTIASQGKYTCKGPFALTFSNLNSKLQEVAIWSGWGWNTTWVHQHLEVGATYTRGYRMSLLSRPKNHIHWAWLLTAWAQVRKVKFRKVKFGMLFAIKRQLLDVLRENSEFTALRKMSW